MESNTANHVTELCRYALKHVSRSGAAKLVLLEVKEQLQCIVLHHVHLKNEIFHWSSSGPK